MACLAVAACAAKFVRDAKSVVDVYETIVTGAGDARGTIGGGALRGVREK